MFIEAFIGSIIGSALAYSGTSKTDGSSNKINTQLSSIGSKLDDVNHTLTDMKSEISDMKSEISDMKSKISDIEIEQSKLFHEFQWHDLVQTLMAKNAVYLGNNILELKENDSVVQLNLVEKRITETKFGKTYVKTFDGCEYLDGKCVHSKDPNGEKWFNLEGKCIHEVDNNGKETWYEYDESNCCIHKKIEHGKDFIDHWYEYDESNRCIYKKVEHGFDFAEYFWKYDAEGKVKQRRIKQKLFHSEYSSPDWYTTYDYALHNNVLHLAQKEVLNERMVEYGNIVHFVSKFDEVVKEEGYATKDQVNNHRFDTRFIDECEWLNRGNFFASRYYLEFPDLYYKSEYEEKGGGICYHIKNSLARLNDLPWENEKDTWTDANGEIEKGFFNFLTHTYEKRIALAKRKLEETKSNLKNSF